MATFEEMLSRLLDEEFERLNMKRKVADWWGPNMRGLKVVLKLKDGTTQNLHMLLGNESEAALREYTIVSGWGVADILGDYRHAEIEQIIIESSDLKAAKSG
jgi:hypothetical protein